MVPSQLRTVVEGYQNVLVSEHHSSTVVDSLLNTVLADNNSAEEVVSRHLGVEVNVERDSRAAEFSFDAENLSVNSSSEQANKGHEEEELLHKSCVLASTENEVDEEYN